MVIDAAVCSRCGGQASLTDHNVRHGWACPHCAQSHWPSSGGGWSAPPAPNGVVAAGSTTPGENAAAARIHPTRAAAPGWTTTLDLVTKPFGWSASPVARMASIVIAGSAVAGVITVARAAFG